MYERLGEVVHRYNHGCLSCPPEIARAPEYKRIHMRDGYGRCFAEICSNCVSLGRAKVLKELKKQAKSERNYAAKLCKLGGEVRYIKESLDRVEAREFLAEGFRSNYKWLVAVQPGKDSLSEQNDDRNK